MQQAVIDRRPSTKIKLANPGRFGDRKDALLSFVRGVVFTGIKDTPS
jgi:hypothetical protein